MGSEMCIRDRENSFLSFEMKILAKLCELSADEWRKIFRNYGATLDLPSILFYKELMVAFPKAKVILTDREPTSWFESWWKSIGMELEGMEKRNGSLQRAITNMR